MSDELVIEKNVPLPNRKTEKYVEAFEKMEDGDSFLVDDEPITQLLRSRISSAAMRAGCQLKQKKEGNGLRIWRVG